MADKRDTKRQRKRLTLKFGKERPEKFGFTEDISRNGLFIKTVSPYPPKTQVYIDIILRSSLVRRHKFSKSPLTPLCQRGGKASPPLEKGDRGGF